MPKACLNCSTENRDEALFCRRCGTPFSSEHASPPTSEPAFPSVFDDDDEERRMLPAACAICGFANPPGARSCEKCGTPLSSMPDPAATLLIPRSAGGARPSHPPAPSHPDDMTTVAYLPPRVPEHDATAAAPGRPSTAYADTPPYSPITPTAAATEPPAARKPVAMWLAIAVAALLLIIAGYWYLNPRTAEPPPALPASAPAASAPIADAPAPVAMPLPPAASAPEPAVFTESASSAAAPTAASAAASAIDDAAKTAKDKAARAKALREQREQAAAAAKKAEQDAAEEKTRASATPSTPAPPRPEAVAAPVARPQSASEICAGRGAIVTAMCESRECGKPEHVNEPRCRQVNADEERRR